MQRVAASFGREQEKKPQILVRLDCHFSDELRRIAAHATKEMGIHVSANAVGELAVLRGLPIASKQLLKRKTGHAIHGNGHNPKHT